MANLQTSIKDNKQNKRRRVYNTRLIKRYKAAIKSFNEMIKEKDLKNATPQLATVYKLLDKAAKKGILKAGNVDRKKSKLAKKINTITAKNVKTAKSNS